MDQFCQCGGTLRFAAESDPGQLCQVFAGQRLEDDLLHARSSRPDRFELSLQRMGRIDFVVSVRADQQQVPHIGSGEKILDQIERCWIEPLPIVEE